MIEVVRSPSEMRTRSAAWRREGRRVAFVPTMGYLHSGHVSLLEEARRQGDVSVLSIFVNPSQFGPTEDLSRYPRDLDGDLNKAAAAGVDVAFVPEAGDMYPDGYQTWVEVKDLSRGLCGDRRPGHFVGVATVVLKLLNVVQPTVALFGEKDFQQLQVLRRMARDLELGVEIRGCPLVREPDGLAMSSRNAYLSPEERERALTLSRALFAARELFASGERSPAVLRGAAHALLDEAQQKGWLKLDYLELDDIETLQPIDPGNDVRRPAVLAVAAFVGATRLIDNVQLVP